MKIKSAMFLICLCNANKVCAPKDEGISFFKPKKSAQVFAPQSLPTKAASPPTPLVQNVAPMLARNAENVFQPDNIFYNATLPEGFMEVPFVMLDQKDWRKNSDGSIDVGIIKQTPMPTSTPGKTKQVMEVTSDSLKVMSFDQLCDEFLKMNLRFPNMMVHSEEMIYLTSLILSKIEKSGDVVLFEKVNFFKNYNLDASKNNNIYFLGNFVLIKLLERGSILQDVCRLIFDEFNKVKNPSDDVQVATFCRSLYEKANICKSEREMNELKAKAAVAGTAVATAEKKDDKQEYKEFAFDKRYWQDEFCTSASVKTWKNRLKDFERGFYMASVSEFVKNCMKSEEKELYIIQTIMDLIKNNFDEHYYNLMQNIAKYDKHTAHLKVFELMHFQSLLQISHGYIAEGFYFGDEDKLFNQKQEYVTECAKKTKKIFELPQVKEAFPEFVKNGKVRVLNEFCRIRIPAISVLQECLINHPFFCKRDLYLLFDEDAVFACARDMYESRTMTQVVKTFKSSLYKQEISKKGLFFVSGVLFETCFYIIMQENKRNEISLKIGSYYDESISEFSIILPKATSATDVLLSKIGGKYDVCVYQTINDVRKAVPFFKACLSSQDQADFDEVFSLWEEAGRKFIQDKSNEVIQLPTVANNLNAMLVPTITSDLPSPSIPSSIAKDPTKKLTPKELEEYHKTILANLEKDAESEEEKSKKSPKKKNNKLKNTNVKNAQSKESSPQKNAKKTEKEQAQKKSVQQKNDSGNDQRSDSSNELSIEDLHQKKDATQFEKEQIRDMEFDELRAKNVESKLDGNECESSKTSDTKASSKESDTKESEVSLQANEKNAKNELQKQEKFKITKSQVQKYLAKLKLHSKIQNEQIKIAKRKKTMQKAFIEMQALLKKSNFAQMFQMLVIKPINSDLDAKKIHKKISKKFAHKSSFVGKIVEKKSKWRKVFSEISISEVSNLLKLKANAKSTWDVKKEEKQVKFVENAIKEDSAAEETQEIKPWLAYEKNKKSAQKPKALDMLQEEITQEEYDNLKEILLESAPKKTVEGLQWENFKAHCVKAINAFLEEKKFAARVSYEISNTAHKKLILSDSAIKIVLNQTAVLHGNAHLYRKNCEELAESVIIGIKDYLSNKKQLEEIARMQELEALSSQKKASTRAASKSPYKPQPSNVRAASKSPLVSNTRAVSKSPAHRLVSTSPYLVRQSKAR